MATCPTCQHPNPDGTEHCARCGRSVTDPGAGAPPTVLSGWRASPDQPLSAPLPQPMVEPIQTPTGVAEDGPPAHPALTRSLQALADDGPRTPAPQARFEYPAALGSSAPVTIRTTSSTVTAPAPQAAPVPAAATPLPASLDSPTSAPGVRLKLVVLRGQRVAVEYPIYEGRNTIGRFVDKPVDIDLVTQEPLEQVWCSRLHAAIVFDRGVALVEDLNSLNGTWVNGARIHPGQLRQVKPNDVIQVGTVQMKLVAC